MTEGIRKEIVAGKQKQLVAKHKFCVLDLFEILQGFSSNLREY